MKLRLRSFGKYLCGVFMFAVVTTTIYAQAEYDIDVFVRGLSKPIPISLAGYSGEVLQVLKFDLEIAGFKVVGESDAQYTLTGSNNDRVEGKLVDNINKTTKFAKAFAGGSLRTRAHALADEVVLAVTGHPGIARTRIAFKLSHGQTSEICVSDYDGHNATVVTADQSIVAAPCWVPGRRMLYYTTYKFGNPDIVSHDLDTAERKIIARYGGSNISPAVSPDGRRVAMILSKSGSPDLFVANADGSDLRQLTQTREDESSPCWSPDGRWICFAGKTAEGRRFLAKVSPNGGSVQRIPISGVVNPSEPDWSPDGKWIAFTSQMRDFNICVVPGSGGEARIVTGGEDPSWAPNSRTIVFTRRSAGGKRSLSLLDVPTKQSKDIPQKLGVCTQPTWSR